MRLGAHRGRPGPGAGAVWEHRRSSHIESLALVAGRAEEHARAALTDPRVARRTKATLSVFDLSTEVHRMFKPQKVRRVRLRVRTIPGGKLRPLAGQYYPGAAGAWPRPQSSELRKALQRFQGQGQSEVRARGRGWITVRRVRSGRRLGWSSAPVVRPHPERLQRRRSVTTLVRFVTLQ